MFIRFFVLLLLGALCAPVMHAVDAPVSDNQLHEVEISLSDTEENTSHEFGLAECSTLFTLTGNTSVKEWATTEFTLISSESGQPIPANFVLKKDGNVYEDRQIQERFSPYLFESGIWLLEVIPLESAFRCQGVLQKEIHVYHESLVYIGSPISGIDDGELASVFRTKSVLFQKIDTTMRPSSEDISAVWPLLERADIVIFGYADVLELFSEMEKIQKVRHIDFSTKRLYIVSAQSRSFLSKVLASPLASLGATHISLISEEQFHTLLTRWSLGENRHATLGEELSYEKKNFSFTLSSFLEYLAYSGVSYQFLGYLLVLAVVALVINILRQVVGFPVFGIYAPILMGIIWTQLGTSFTGVFFLIAGLSFLSGEYITHRIHLLFNAKRALLISLYILFIFLVIGLDNFFAFWLFRLNVFDGSAMIITIFALLFVAEKVFGDMNLLSLKGVQEFAQYTLLVGIIALILSYKPLQYFLISYPDIVFLIVIANLLVGRYMGLQLSEYFRFSPILQDSTEE